MNKKELLYAKKLFSMDRGNNPLFNLTVSNENIKGGIIAAGKGLRFRLEHPWQFGPKQIPVASSDLIWPVHRGGPPNTSGKKWPIT